MISPDIISLPFYLLYIMATVDLSLGCTLKSHGSLKKIPIPNICPDVLGQSPRAVPVVILLKLPHVNVQTRLEITHDHRFISII